MRIAIVVPGGLHPSGDREVVPSWLALFASLANSHEIHAFVLKHLAEPTTYQLRGITVHDLGRPSLPAGLTRWAQERALSRALNTHGPFDLIHGFFADPAGRLAARAGRRLAIPSVVTCDSGEFVSIPSINYGSQRTGRGRRAVDEACSLATRVHVCTRYMSALAHAKNIHTTIIPLTSVTSQYAAFRPNSRRPLDAPFRLIQVASLSRVKNQRLLIDALRIVRDRINAHLDLVGEDTLNGELQRHAASIGLDAHVTFHGFLPQRQVIDLLRTADLYVQSSLHEAAGVSVLEAAAAGVPTVGTLAGYVADWAPLKATAVGDAIPESLADAILASLADHDRRRSIGAAARTLALAQDATFSAMRFADLYRELKR
jgi:glycosyltransferase involved in cell wall biosynthesis